MNQPKPLRYGLSMFFVAFLMLEGVIVATGNSLTVTVVADEVVLQPSAFVTVTE